MARISRQRGRAMKQYRDGGEAILEAFRSLGLDYIISSPGSEWSPVWEALARQKVNQQSGPTYIDCWHETLAVDMAMGYTQMTGRMQAVLLHAGAGLLQGSAGMHSAMLAEVPMVIMSGESMSFGEDPQLAIEPQWYRSLSIVGGPQRLVEPVTKWATQAANVHTLYEHVVRAGEFAQRTPMGPVYLNAPLEVMLQQWTPPDNPRRVPPPPKTRATDADVERIAELLVGARNPVILTETAQPSPHLSTSPISLAFRSAGAPSLQTSQRTTRCISAPASSRSSRMPTSYCWSAAGRHGIRRAVSRRPGPSSPSTRTRSRA